MAITTMINRIAQYFSEAVARIFSPSDNEYPVTGVQPFTGDPHKERKDSD